MHIAGVFDKWIYEWDEHSGAGPDNGTGVVHGDLSTMCVQLKGFNDGNISTTSVFCLRHYVLSICPA